MTAYLEQNPEVNNTFKQVILNPNGIEIQPIPAFKLQGVGLISFHDQLAFPSCLLYQSYFAHVLHPG